MVYKKPYNSGRMEVDRLSNLPDHIIYHILSFMDAKSAVQTSVLAKSWKHHWTRIHILDLDYRCFTNSTCFKYFTMFIMKYWKPFENSLCKLRYHCRAVEMQTFVIPLILTHPRAIHFEEVDINCTVLPLIYIECKYLSAFKLSHCTVEKFPNTINPLLTTLELTGVQFLNTSQKGNLFSQFRNLENLRLVDCSFAASGMFEVSTPRLVNLVISNLKDGGHETDLKLVICASMLKFLQLKGTYPLALVMDKSPRLEKVDVHVVASSPLHETNDLMRDLIGMYERFSHVKSLTLLLETLKGRKFMLQHSTPVLSEN